MPVWSNPMADTAQALRAGTQELKAAFETVCNRLDRLEGQVLSLLPEADRAGRLRREAVALADTFPDPDCRPALFGVSVGVKDCIRVEGHATRAGSRLPPEVFAGPEAAIVARFRAQGAIVLGKTVTTEFTLGRPGPTRNPLDPAHTPGGSSSGSAAAVAAGFCPLAIGTQTGGSVIRPAAYCGVVGYKPTFGRIPVQGIVPYSPSLDHIGLFTQDLAGLILAASIACDDWRAEAVPSADAPRPVLGIPDGPVMEPVEPIALAAFHDTVARLRDAGYAIRTLAFPDDLDGIRARRRELALGELAEVHRDWFAAHRALYSDYTAERITVGRKVRADTLARLRDELPRQRRSVDEQIARSGADAILTPAAPGPAPAGLGSTGSSVMNQPWTYTGHPVVTLPCGPLPGGRLPLGLQVIARHGQDERLLGWAVGMASAIA
jgi:Asp-tRNA(Asn)/Glu-tRNA(Gln) amidotransferase A subunit family amidase